MNGLSALVGHSLRRRRGFLAAATLMLVAFQFFMIVAARALENSGGFRQIEALIPEFLAQWTNTMAASFQGFVLFGYTDPAVQLVLIAIAISIATEPAAEIESKFIDLLMARPLARRVVMARTLVVLVVTTAGMLVCMLAATWLGLRWLAPLTARLPQPHVVASLAGNLAVLVLAWGGVAMAIASFSKRRATAAAACGFLAFAAFVLDYVGRFWDAAKPASRVSPFHYFDPFALIGGQPLKVADLVTLAAIFFVFAAIANVVYARRDL